jgi:DNA-binding NarL/FixJ family response regulator
LGKIRVVLADDHQQMTAIVRQTLGEEFEVVGTVEDGRQAVDAVLALNSATGDKRKCPQCRRAAS